MKRYTLILALFLASCSTTGTQDPQKSVVDVLKHYHAVSLDTALVAATHGRQFWQEKRDAYVVLETTQNRLNDPYAKRIIAGYDGIIASVDADIALLKSLKEKADATSTPATK